MKLHFRILLTIIMNILCINSIYAIDMKVGDTKSLTVGSVPGALQGCQWTISRSDCVVFTHTPGKYDTSAEIKAVKGFSGAPCVVQCTYYYLEVDPITGRYTYSRSSYKSWDIFVSLESGGGSNDNDNPSTTEEVIELDKYSASLVEGGSETINVRFGGMPIYWKIENPSIAQIINSENNGWKVEIRGLVPGVTNLYATDNKGGKATCRVTVSKKTFSSGDNVKTMSIEGIPLGFTVTDPYKMECELTYIGETYWTTKETVTIPETVEGLTVVSVGSVRTYDESFSQTHVILPNTIRELKDDCFGSTSFKTVKLNTGIKRIGSRAFANSNIESISIPEGVELMGEACFWMCKNLKSVSLPTSLKKIPSECFYYCINLSEIEIPMGIEEIWEMAFLNTRVSHFSLPSSIRLLKNSCLGSRICMRIICESEIPFEVEEGVIQKNYIIYVPKDAIDKYKDKEFWRIAQLREVGDDKKDSYLMFDAGIESGYVPRPELFESESNSVFKLSYNEFDMEWNYTFALSDNKSFTRYGTTSTIPVFDRIDDWSEKHIVEYQLVPFNEQGVNAFHFSQNHADKNIVVHIDYESKKVRFIYDNTSGIQDIVIKYDENQYDDDGVVYYDLQGLRIDNPGTGMYIKQLGKTSQKVIIK